MTTQVQTDNLDTLLKELEALHEKNADFLVPCSLIRIDGNSLQVYKRTGERVEYTPNSLFHDQLANHLGIPKSYYTRLRENQNTLQHLAPDEDMKITGTPLYNTVVNTHLAERGEEMRLLRVQDGVARAFLSEKFNRDLDNYQVALYAARAMRDMDIPKESVSRCGVTHERLHLQVLAPGLKATINTPRRLGEVIEGGFQLTNSEVGCGSLDLALYIRVLSCLNGATQTKVVSRRHVGRILSAGEDGAVYSDETREAEAKARLLALRDQIRDLLGGDLFRKFIEKMQGATEHVIPVDKKPLADVIELTKKRLSLTDVEGFDVYRNLNMEKDYSLYGLANVVTATARETANADRRLELEALGGEMFGWRGRELAGITH